MLYVEDEHEHENENEDDDGRTLFGRNPCYWGVGPGGPRRFTPGCDGFFRWAGGSVGSPETSLRRLRRLRESPCRDVLAVALA